ncbi:MAG: hypothetical protein ACIAS6_10550 [Phycisphaerales bacterium JB060]
MKRGIGGLLLLIGLGLMITGIAMALQTMVGIYYDMNSDPLAERATTAEPEQEAARAMLRWAVVGFAGVPLAAVGAFLAMKSRVGRMRARTAARGR